MLDFGLWCVTESMESRLHTNVPRKALSRLGRATQRANDNMEKTLAAVTTLLCGEGEVKDLQPICCHFPRCLIPGE